MKVIFTAAKTAALAAVCLKVADLAAKKVDEAWDKVTKK